MLSPLLRRYTWNSSWLYNVRIFIALCGTVALPWWLNDVKLTIPLTLGVVAGVVAGGVAEGAELVVVAGALAGWTFRICSVSGLICWSMRWGSDCSWGAKPHARNSPWVQA